MKKQFLYLFLLITFISCGDNVTFNNPALEGQVNNVFWRAADAKATLINGVLTIEGYARNEKLTLTIPSPKSLVSYNNKNTHLTYFLGTTNQNIMSSYVSSVSTVDSPIYKTIVTPGPVNKILISAAGLGYTNTIAGTSGGKGLGLKVNLVVTSLGAISSVTVTSPGSGYTSGDVITVIGGNGKAKLVVQNVIASNGEIVITGYDGVNNIVSGTFKFNAINTNGDPLAEPNLNFQYGNFYIPVK
jgi:hypothetical protein